MPLAVSLSATNLSALLNSRICHDLISPVGAINNAIELYDEGEAQEDALNLIRLSAANASARLQFARIAFGAAGSAGTTIDTDEAHTVAQKYMTNEKAELIWDGPCLLLPKNEVKLLLNLLLVANASIPRGGIIRFSLKQENAISSFRFVCTGKILRIPARFEELYSGQIPAEPIDAHSVQPYYTLLLAEMARMPINLTVTDTEITFSAGQI